MNSGCQSPDTRQAVEAHRVGAVVPAVQLREPRRERAPEFSLERVDLISRRPRSKMLDKARINVAHRLLERPEQILDRRVGAAGHRALHPPSVRAVSLSATSPFAAGHVPSRRSPESVVTPNQNRSLRKWCSRWLRASRR